MRRKLPQGLKFKEFDPYPEYAPQTARFPVSKSAAILRFEKLRRNAHNRCALRFVTPHSQHPARPTMPALITLGRVLFAVPFIYSGATKLFGIQPTADFIAAVIPYYPYTSQLEAMTGMSTPQILAIAVGMFEVIAGLMIALNFGARFFAILLIFFVAATIYYFPPENAKTLVDALKSLSIIGALFIIVGYGRAPRKVEPAYGDV
jgi:putative oxidoreductase